MIDTHWPRPLPVIGQPMMTDSSLATPTLALKCGLGLEMQKKKSSCPADRCRQQRRSRPSTRATATSRRRGTRIFFCISNPNPHYSARVGAGLHLTHGFLSPSMHFGSLSAMQRQSVEGDTVLAMLTRYNRTR